MSDNYDLRDDFDDLRLLAHGGMGAVYLANQRSLNRRVVVKTILAGERIPAESTERLISEGQLLARLAHPNIVTVYDLKQTDNAAYLIEEYVQGTDLRHWMKAKNTASVKMTPEVFWHLVKQITSGLEAAHRVGIIHRDLKPENILIREDLCIKLCDFGISTITTESAKRMSSSSGTLAYMAPELFDDAPVISKALDYYSFGCILIELLCGINPFLRSTDDSIGRIIKAKLTNATLDFGLLPPWFLKHQDNLNELLGLEPAVRLGAFERIASLAASEDPGVQEDGVDTENTMTTLDSELRHYIAPGNEIAPNVDTKGVSPFRDHGASAGGLHASMARAKPPKVYWYRGIRRVVLTLAILFSLFCLAGAIFALIDIVSRQAEMRSNPNYSKWEKTLVDAEYLALSPSDQAVAKAELSRQWRLDDALAQVDNDKQGLAVCGLLIISIWLVLFLLRWFLRGFVSAGTKQTPVAAKPQREKARRQKSGRPDSVARTPQNHPEVHAASARIDKPRGWKCPRCALSNTEFATACESCGLEKPQS